MPLIKKSFKKTAKKPARPSFAAPVPPESSKQVLTNTPDPDELTQNAGAYVEEIDAPAPETLPDDTPILKARVQTPPETTARIITRSQSSEKPSPLKDMLDEEPDPEEDTPPLEAQISKPSITLPEKETIMDTPAPAATKTPPGNLITVGVIILLIIFAGAGWGLYLNQVQPDLIPSFQAPTPTPTPQPTTAPTPTPKPAIVLEVLNGSGVAGAAADTKTKLEALGYTVTSVGNADNSNYQVTQVLTAPGFTRIDELLASLEDKFDLATTAGNLAAGATIDARIILGKNWFDQD